LSRRADGHVKPLSNLPGLKLIDDEAGSHFAVNDCGGL